jgi:hypothetical protein
MGSPIGINAGRASKWNVRGPAAGCQGFSRRGHSLTNPTAHPMQSTCSFVHKTNMALWKSEVHDIAQLLRENICLWPCVLVGIEIETHYDMSPHQLLKIRNMKKILGALGILAITTSAVAADWVKIIETSAQIVYLDKSSNREVGPTKRSAWTLIDFKKPMTRGSDTFLSLKSFDIYSCSERTILTKEQVPYSEPQGGGNSFKSINFSPARPHHLPPDSTGEDVWKVVCSAD